MYLLNSCSGADGGSGGFFYSATASSDAAKSGDLSSHDVYLTSNNQLLRSFVRMDNTSKSEVGNIVSGNKTDGGGGGCSLMSNGSSTGTGAGGAGAPSNGSKSTSGSSGGLGAVWITFIYE